MVICFIIALLAMILNFSNDVLTDNASAVLPLRRSVVLCHKDLSTKIFVEP